jgi:D-sedoheptulose 7-phosphate isomerase
LAQPGDVLVGISTSGTSRIVVRAFEVAGSEVVKVARCGRAGLLADRANVALCIPADSTAHVQAAHIAISHAICMVLEARFALQAPKPTPA